MRQHGMRLLGACALICVVACTDEAARSETTIDYAMATMDAAVDAPRGPSVPRDGSVSAAGLGCPAMWEECAAPSPPWRTIAQASTFGAGARFRALARDLVLVEGGGAPWRVVQIGPDLEPGQPSFVRRFAFPPGNWEPRGLARTAGVAVIACDARCRLLEAALTGSTLRATSELPEGYQVNGLAAADEALCVYGSDVSCFAQGQWTSTLQADEVIALAMTSPRAVALTRSGRVFSAVLAGALPQWVEEAPVQGFAAVAVSGRRALFSSANGWLERTDGQDHACEVPDGVAAVLVAFGGSPSLLTGRGDLLTVQTAGFCRSQRVQVGEVIAASSGACGGEPRVLTDSQLIGDNRCDLQ